MSAQRINPVLVEKARERFDEIVGVADGEGRVFDDDRRVIGEFWDALDRQQKWFDELGLKGEWRAAASDEGDGLSDRNGRCSTRREAEASLESLLDAEPPYDKGWIESRVVSDWRPVEQGDPQ